MAGRSMPGTIWPASFPEMGQRPRALCAERAAPLHRAGRAFTLVELLVVIAIIGVLVSLLLRAV